MKTKTNSELADSFRESQTINPIDSAPGKPMANKLLKKYSFINLSKLIINYKIHKSFLFQIFYLH